MVTQSCVLSDAWFQIRGKLLLSRKLHHFRGSCFSQCFFTINLSPLFVTKKGLMLIIILNNCQSVHLSFHLIYSSCEDKDPPKLIYHYHIFCVCLIENGWTRAAISAFGVSGGMCVLFLVFSSLLAYRFRKEIILWWSAKTGKNKSKHDFSLP